MKTKCLRCGDLYEVSDEASPVCGRCSPRLVAKMLLEKVKLNLVFT